MEHKNIETINDWLKSRWKVLFLNRESETQSNVECVKVKYLDPLGETFPFQCSCGVKHQFSYKVNEGVHHLEAMLSCNNIGSVIRAPVEECQSEEQRYKPGKEISLKQSPNVKVRGCALLRSPS